MAESLETRQALLVSIVDSSEENTWYEIEHLGHHLKRFKIQFDEDGYTWCGEISWNNTKASGWAHPVKGHYVIFFKTIKGVKLNFLKNNNNEWNFKF